MNELSVGKYTLAGIHFFLVRFLINWNKCFRYNINVNLNKCSTTFNYLQFNAPITFIHFCCCDIREKFPSSTINTRVVQSYDSLFLIVTHNFLHLPGIQTLTSLAPLEMCMCVHVCACVRSSSYFINMPAPDYLVPRLRIVWSHVSRFNGARSSSGSHTHTHKWMRKCLTAAVDIFRVYGQLRKLQILYFTTIFAYKNSRF